MNFLKRTISIILLAPLVVLLTYIGGMPFYLMVVVACFLMLREWYRLTKSVEGNNVIIWQIISVFYIIIPCIILLYVAYIGGSKIILLLIFIVWLADIGAYIFGKLLGGLPILGFKPVPKISPNKTLVGFVGGFVFPGFFAVIIYRFLEFFSKRCFFDICLVKESMPIKTVLFFVIVVLLSQIGDLFESWVKRKFNKKDSGNLIPGHGGLLDRLDGLLLATPMLLLII